MPVRPSGVRQAFGMTPDHPLFQQYLQQPDALKQQFASMALSGLPLDRIQSTLGKNVASSALTGNVAAQQAAPTFGFGLRPQGAAGSTPSASPYGGGGGLAGNLQQQQQSAFEQAKAANEARYQEILGGFGQRRSAMESAFGQQQGALAGQGRTAAADIARRFTGERSRGMAGLYAAGISGTTIAPTLGIAYQRAEAGEQTRLQESLGRQRADLLGQQASALSGLEGERLAFQERRTDAYPSQNPYLALQQQAGQTGAGGAYGAPTTPLNYYMGSALRGTSSAVGVSSPRQIPAYVEPQPTQYYEPRAQQGRRTDRATAAAERVRLRAEAKAAARKKKAGG